MLIGHNMKKGRRLHAVCFQEVQSNRIFPFLAKSSDVGGDFALRSSYNHR
jgi:hypothetical protein